MMSDQDGSLEDRNLSANMFTSFVRDCYTDMFAELSGLDIALLDPFMESIYVDVVVLTLRLLKLLS